MNLIEAVATLYKMPGWFAVSSSGHVYRVNRGGYLIDATRPRTIYVRATVRDLLDETWGCFSPDQIQRMAEESSARA